MKRLISSVILGLWTFAPLAQAEGLQPHKANYTLNLVKLKAGALAAAGGSAVYQIRDLCTSWSVSQKFDVQVMNGDGSVSAVSFQSATLEEKDASALRFHTVQTQDGETVSETAGHAQRRRDGRLVVNFTKPETKTVVLTKDTVLPIQQTELLLMAARKGLLHLAQNVFDGSSPEGGLPTYATLGTLAPTTPELATPLLNGIPAVPISVASFGADATNLLPESSYSDRLWANGVEDHLVIDFGDYVLSGQLDSLIALPAPHCQNAHY